MTKELENMTLKELGEHCKNTKECKECRFFIPFCVSRSDPPSMWIESMQVCDEDLERLKVIKLLFPSAEGVYATNVSSAAMGDAAGKKVVFVNSTLFHDIANTAMVLFDEVEGLE